jgi:hypothetical protein
MDLGFTTAVYVVAGYSVHTVAWRAVRSGKRKACRLVWHCWHGAGGLGDRHWSLGLAYGS